jgi:hypothetical protein
MSVSVGGVTIEFDGDASGAKAAMQAVAEKLDVLVAKERDLKRALDAATASGKMSDAALGALRSAHDEATTAVKRLTGELQREQEAEVAAARATKAAAEAAKAAEKAQQEQARAVERSAAEAKKAADSHGEYGERARKVDDAMGALQTSIGGVSAAFGVQASAMTDVVGGVADVAMSFGRGGPLLAALTVSAAAAMYLIDQFDLFGQKAEAAAKRAAKALDDLDKKAYDIRIGTEAKIAGTSPEIVSQRRAVERAQQEVGMAELRAGEVGSKAGSLESLKEMAAAGGWMPAGGKEAIERLNAANKKLAAEQNVLSSMLEDVDVDTMIKATDEANAAEAQFAKDLQAAGESLREKNIDERYAALITSLDAAKAAADVAAELSVNEYTAEDRASRESRGVFEVSKEDFDARLAGIDPEEAKRITEEAVAAIINPFGEATETITIGLTDVVTATADDIAKMNEAFLSVEDAAIDLRDPLEQFGDGVRDAFDKLGGASDLAVTAIEGGASGLGQAAGGAVGGVIGTAVGGPGGTAVGSALGSLIGGLLGDSLDKLIEALGILTPLFDAIGTIIGALQPILVVLGGLFITLADAIVALAPIVLILARLFGANLVIFVRLLQVILLLVPIISMAASFILVWVDFIVMAIDMIDKNFLRPLFDGAAFLVNGFIMFYNSIIDLIRLIPGLGKFGSKAELISYGAGSGAAAGVDDMINDVSEAAALAAAEGAAGGAGGEASGGADTGSTETTSEESWSNEMANVPSGFKALAAIYANADAESGAGMLTAQQAMSMVINIENWNSRGDSQRDWEDLRRYARQGHKGKKAASSRSFGDEKN